MAARPEKGAMLWKWLMEHIKNKREKEEQEKRDDVSHILSLTFDRSRQQITTVTSVNEKPCERDRHI